MKKTYFSKPLCVLPNIVAIFALLGSTLAFATPKNFTDTVETHNTTINGNSRFTTRTLDNGQTEETTILENGARTGCCLDARVERFYDRRIPTNTTDNFEWRGFVIVDRAHDTTVFQLLNTDLSDSDRHRPTLFLEANRFTNSDGDDILRICDGRCNEGGEQIRWQRDDNNFNLRVRIVRGTTAEVYIDEVLRYTKTLDRYIDRPGNQFGDRTTVRYGAYHHDTRIIRNSAGTRFKEALSEARIRIRNPRFRRL